MTAHDTSLHDGRPSILRWLGFGRNPDPAAAAADDPLHAASPDTARAARLSLLADVTLFLDTHDIDVTALTLAAAHDYLTGTDLALVRAIDRRLAANLPITAEWLETASQEDSREDEREALTLLMTKLENNLDEFGKTTHAARSAASDYSTALEAHVGGLDDDPDSPAAVISELASLARAMLTRTRDLEREMSRSELQTRTLRRNLDQARRTADKDHLTGLPNRRAFDALLESEMAVAAAEHEHLCVAFCDIDDFKRVNDTHGHEAGDRVLRAVAQNLARISSDKCHVARHGGEEFVILFRGLTLSDAWDMLDEARSQQAERRLVNRANDMPFGKVTFSGGMADVFAYPEPRAALRAADQALYRAKEEGRNRIELAKPEA